MSAEFMPNVANPFKVSLVASLGNPGTEEYQDFLFQGVTFDNINMIVTFYLHSKETALV